jgi:hypothetical protein
MRGRPGSIQKKKRRPDPELVQGKKSHAHRKRRTDRELDGREENTGKNFYMPSMARCEEKEGDFGRGRRGLDLGFGLVARV